MAQPAPAVLRVDLFCFFFLLLRLLALLLPLVLRGLLRAGPGPRGSLGLVGGHDDTLLVRLGLGLGRPVLSMHPARLLPVEVPPHALLVRGRHAQRAVDLLRQALHLVLQSLVARLQRRRLGLARLLVRVRLRPQRLQLVQPAEGLRQLAHARVAVAQQQHVVRARPQPPDALHVDQHARHALLAEARQAGERLHRQAGAHDDAQVRGGRQRAVQEEVLGQRLAEEDNVGLDDAVALRGQAEGHLALLDVLAHQVVRVGALAVDAVLRREAAVGLDDHVARQAGLALEAVDVLGEVLEQEALVVQQPDERVRNGRAVAPRGQLAGQGVEGARVLAEEVDVEDGLGVGEVEVGEIGIDARVGGAEVGDAGGRADAGAGLVVSACAIYIWMDVCMSYHIHTCGCMYVDVKKRNETDGAYHDDDAPDIPLADVLGDGLDGARLEGLGRGALVDESGGLVAHAGRGCWSSTRGGAVPEPADWPQMEQYQTGARMERSRRLSVSREVVSVLLSIFSFLRPYVSRSRPRPGREGGLRA